MSTTTPNWTDNVSVLAATSLSRGSFVTATLNLSSKYEAYLFLRVGRTTSTSLDQPIAIVVRRMSGHPRNLSSTVLSDPPKFGPANATFVSADSTSGTNILHVNDSTGFLSNGHLFIYDAGLARLEFHRITKVTSGTIYLDRNLDNTHTAVQADVVSNAADIYAPIYVPGGCTYQVIFDYGAALSGDAVVVQALAQTHDSDTTV